MANDREFNVVYGESRLGGHEIAIQSRSMMQVLIDFGSYIEVPARDIAEGRVFVRAAQRRDRIKLFPALLRVRSSESPPDDAHVAVNYRDGWFCIDDRDHDSKAAFNFLMLLFSLTETGHDPGGADRHRAGALARDDRACSHARMSATSGSHSECGIG